MACFLFQIPSSAPALCTLRARLAMSPIKLRTIWLVAAFILPSRLRRTLSKEKKRKVYASQVQLRALRKGPLTSKLARASPNSQLL
eukprot:1146613-Pelagomonas_calceolata.AAC.2